MRVVCSYPALLNLILRPRALNTRVHVRSDLQSPKKKNKNFRKSGKKSWKNRTQVEKIISPKHIARDICYVIGQK